MTPPDPKPTAPPTVAPATDQEIARLIPSRVLCEVDPDCECCYGVEESDGIITFGSHENCRCDLATVRQRKRLIARIESDRAEHDRLRSRLHAVTTAEVDACVECETLRARVAELEAAGSAFVNKLDLCLPSIGAHYALQQIRTGVSYNGPNFGEELKVLRAALKPEPR